MLKIDFSKTKMDYKGINSAALDRIESILDRWLPDGYYCGTEYVALNPRRGDNHHGSFKINIVTGKWADFASGDKGGDIISLAAYLFGISQYKAAIKLAEMLGVKI